MNEQQKYPSDAGIEWTHVFGPNTGRTWNPLGGCEAGCRWKMPDGTLVGCYAESMAEAYRSHKFFAGGFDRPYSHPDRLMEPARIKGSAGIFIGSMTDLMGFWFVPQQIQAVLDICAQTPRHIYFLLTKNAPRLKQFKFPRNVWVGVSIPATMMYGKVLSRAQQARWLSAALDTLGEIDVSVRWLSAEPLAWDVADVLYKRALPETLDWMVIGAASHKREYHQPNPQWVKRLLIHCEVTGIKVFMKGNLTWSPRIEEWPAVPMAAKVELEAQQMALF